MYGNAIAQDEDQMYCELCMNSLLISIFAMHFGALDRVGFVRSYDFIIIKNSAGRFV